MQEHVNFVVLRSRQFSLAFCAEIGGVDHGGVFADRVNEFFRGESENQLCASQADCAVECAPSSHHDHFMLQPGRIGKLPDVLVIGAGHARGVAAAIAPAAPEVMNPDSAPVNSDKRLPTARCNSSMLTKCCAASTCACRTSGNSSDPLR